MSNYNAGSVMPPEDEFPIFLNYMIKCRATALAMGPREIKVPEYYSYCFWSAFRAGTWDILKNAPGAGDFGAIQFMIQGQPSGNAVQSPSEYQADPVFKRKLMTYNKAKTLDFFDSGHVKTVTIPATTTGGGSDEKKLYYYIDIEVNQGRLLMCTISMPIYEYVGRQGQGLYMKPVGAHFYLPEDKVWDWNKYNNQNFNQNNNPVPGSGGNSQSGQGNGQGNGGNQQADEEEPNPICPLPAYFKGIADHEAFRMNMYNLEQQNGLFKEELELPVPESSATEETKPKQVPSSKSIFDRDNEPDEPFGPDIEKFTIVGERALASGAVKIPQALKDLLDRTG